MKYLIYIEATGASIGSLRCAADRVEAQLQTGQAAVKVGDSVTANTHCVNLITRRANKRKPMPIQVNGAAIIEGGEYTLETDGEAVLSVTRIPAGTTIYWPESAGQLVEDETEVEWQTATPGNYVLSLVHPLYLPEVIKIDAN